MNAKLYAKLVDVMEKFLDDASPETDIGKVQYVTDRLANLMADAAKIVFDASDDKEEWLRKEGLL